MSRAVFQVGDTRDLTAQLADGSVDLILSSPPYLALRSYLPKDHPDKHREIGSEPTPAAFIDTLLHLTAEWRRVLTRHGSLCIELGDVMSGSGGAGGDYNDKGMRELQPRFAGSGSKHRMESAKPGTNSRLAAGHGWPLAKSRTLIPELYRVALAYGINPLTGTPSPAGRWRVRQVHYHCRPNPPVGALGDKFRPSVSEWVIACTSAKRWFDLDAVRTPVVHPEATATHRAGKRDIDGSEGSTLRLGDYDGSMSAGAPPLDHSWDDWDDWFPAAQRTPTTPYPGAHYATFGPTVIRPFIEAMGPMQVCTVCGEPRRRITTRDFDLNTSRPQARRALELAKAGGLTDEHLAAVRATGITDAGKAQVTQSGTGKNTARVRELAAEAKQVLGGYFREFTYNPPRSAGWTHCACGDGCRPTTWKTEVVETVEVLYEGEWGEPLTGIDYDGCKTRTKQKRKTLIDDLGHCADPSHWRNGLVFDPFAGTFTTGEVATGCGRDALGYDIDQRNVDLARQRCGMLLEVPT